MPHDEQIRCWKDPDYRDAVAGGGGTVPEHPAGAVEIPDEDLAGVAGGQSEWITSAACCGGFSARCFTITGTPLCTALCTITIVTTSDMGICDAT